MKRIAPEIHHREDGEDEEISVLSIPSVVKK
jgi:hypothetical protein